MVTQHSSDNSCRSRKDRQAVDCYWSRSFLEVRFQAGRGATRVYSCFAVYRIYT